VNKQKVCLVSLGCPKNLVDAEVMLGHLPPDRFAITNEELEADILIINTCAFIQDAQEESIDTILEATRFKEHGRCRLLIVTGCLPQRYQQQLAEQLPEVDLFLGTGDAARIVEQIDAWQQAGHQRCCIGAPDSLYEHDTPRLQASPFYSAYVKIAEGCSNHCSYCIIPQLRGPLRSRSIASIVTEVRQRVGAGVREVNLIAQDITAYGRDRADGTCLEDLLRELVQIDELRWLRLLYAYPDGISDELIELMATHDKICPYLDLPLQHVADDLLRAMNRRLDRAGIDRLVRRLRDRVPQLTLRTSFIVGFPGETAEHFQQLLEFVEQGHFDRVGVFRYSREEGTAAALLDNQVPEREKKKRQNKLMKAQSRVSFRKHQALRGQQIAVLVEGYSEETDLLLQGRAISQAPDIDGLVYITAGQANVGDIVPLQISDTTEYDLIGEIVEAEADQP